MILRKLLKARKDAEREAEEGKSAALPTAKSKAKAAAEAI
jgi:hypothetical protein